MWHHQLKWRDMENWDSEVLHGRMMTFGRSTTLRYLTSTPLSTNSHSVKPNGRRRRTRLASTKFHVFLKCGVHIWAPFFCGPVSLWIHVPVVGHSSTVISRWLGEHWSNGDLQATWSYDIFWRVMGLSRKLRYDYLSRKNFAHSSLLSPFLGPGNLPGLLEVNYGRVYLPCLNWLPMQYTIAQPDPTWSHRSDAIDNC